MIPPPDVNFIISLILAFIDRTFFASVIEVKETIFGSTCYGSAFNYTLDYLSCDDVIDCYNEYVINLANELWQNCSCDKNYFPIYVLKWFEKNFIYDVGLVYNFPKASEVLKTKRGVCKEFSVAYCAIMRAKKIPCKYIVGYTYVPELYYLVGHAWNEVCINGVWQIIDATHPYRSFNDFNLKTYICYAPAPINNEKSTYMMMLYAYIDMSNPYNCLIKYKYNPNNPPC